MINANELRVGNWVKVKTSNDAGFYQVEEIGGWIRNWATKKKDAGFVDERQIKISGGARNGETHTESNLRPVELSPELLVKFDFIYEDLIDDSPFERWIAKDYEQFWVWNYNKKHWLFCLGNGYETARSDFKYLHQLQNLYFALTGTELVYNK